LEHDVTADAAKLRQRLVMLHSAPAHFHALCRITQHNDSVDNSVHDSFQLPHYSYCNSAREVGIMSTFQQHKPL